MNSARTLEPPSAKPSLDQWHEAGVHTSSLEHTLRAAIAKGRSEAIKVAKTLRGEFAAGIADAVSGRALLVLDRFATQSLCYRVEGDRLLFGSSASKVAGPQAEIDTQAIFDYLYFHCIPSPRTVFKGVHRLPPGHAAWFEHGQVELVELWTPDLTENSSCTSFNDLKIEFLRLTQEAVASRLDGTQPACFLSGGTDSSTVAGMIGRAAGRPAISYSIGFEAEGYDEMAYARLAAKQYGTRHTEYYVTPADLVAGMPLLAAHHDQPFGNSSSLPAYYCALRAQQDGVTRLLAGDGGDELFGGNTRYAKQKVFGWYDALPSNVRKGTLEPLSATRLAQTIPVVRKGASYVNQAKVPMPDRMQTYNLLHRLGIPTIFAPGFLQQVDTQAPLAHERGVWGALSSASPLNRMLAFDWRYTLAENDLVKVRSSTELASVTATYPLLDDALVDFSLRLPSSYKLKGLKLRWFFKEALRGFLPDEIIKKQKHGFGLPFGVWLQRDSALQTLARDALGTFAGRGVIRPAFSDDLLARLLPKHPAFYGEMVWLLVMLELWLRQHAPNWRATD